MALIVSVSASSQGTTKLEYERSRDEEGVFTFALTATGDHEFTVRIGSSSMRYYANDAFINNDKVYVYGYLNNRDSEIFYQAWLWVLDLSGNTLHNKTIAFGELSEVSEVLTFEEGLVFVANESSVEDYNYVFQQTYLVAFDPYYDTYNVEVLDFQVKRLEKHDDRWLLSGDYQGDYDVGVSHDLSMLWKGEVSGIEPYQEYYGEVEIDFINTVLINGEAVQNGAVIDYPGNYILQFESTVFPFVVHPEIVGIYDGLVTSHPIAIDYPKGQLFLNNELYVSNSLIKKAGNYTFKLQGINQYTYEIDFIIDSNLEGVLHNQVYQTPRTLTFNGEGYLNHHPFESGGVIDQDGIYTLDIYGVNGYHEHHRFHLTLHETEVSNSPPVWVYQGTLAVVFVSIIGYIAYQRLLKK